MAPYLMTVELPNVNGLIEDVYTNNFAISASADMPAAEMDIAISAVGRFYTELRGTRRVGEFISSTVSRAVNACKVKAYDLGSNLGEGERHGSPMAIYSFTLPAATLTDALPHEVAFCLTLEAVGRSVAAVEAPDSGDPGTETDRPMQRRTGRVYIGPLSRAAIDDAADLGRPHADLGPTCRLAALALDDELDALVVSSARLGVWSRRNEVVLPIEAVVTDNAFDTQRRRGLAATVRTRSSV